MACKQLSEFEKGPIVAYNDYGLLLCNIAKKLNYNYSLIDIFLKNYKETRNHHKKEDFDCKRKATVSEDTKILRITKWQHTATSQQLKDKMKLI